MPTSLQNCPQCGFAVRFDDSDLQRCPKCHADLTWPIEHRTLDRLFWTLFTTTPLLAFFTALLLEFQVVPLIPPGFPLLKISSETAGLIVLLVGGAGAGYFLAKTQSHGPGLLPLCIFHTLWILLTYAFVAGIFWALTKKVF